MSKRYGDFPVSKLVTIKTVRHKLSKIDFVKNGKYPCYSSDTNNNGILGYTNNPEFIISDDNPCYLIFGDHTRTINIAYKSFSVLDNVKVLVPQTDNEEALLYMICVWQKQIPNMGYARHWALAKECILKLPLVDGTVDKIDYIYMQKYISELESKCVSKLDSYLKNSKLDDTELTDEEKNILIKKMQFKEYRIGELFEKLKASYKGLGRRQDNVSKVQNTEFSLPLINCKDGNNGIMYYGREQDFDYYTNVLSVIYNGPPTVGQVYAQEKIGVYTDAYLIALKKEIMPEMSLDLCFYLKTAVEKAIHNTKYSRADKATWYNKVENDYIYLPTSDGVKPDYTYMEKYIQAQKKVVIKGAIEFKNTIISL